MLLLVVWLSGSALSVGSSRHIAARDGPWQPDLGDGTYRNPVIFADYSDPDVVRNGDDFYLVSSSFHCVPGLPILHSRDLVNWAIVGHAAGRLPSPRYDTPQHGGGIWAPSLRYHAGEFWIFFGDPDLGIFMTKARDPRGPWEPLVLVKAARGWIDPCPLWDDDGSAYLVHAWAKSRAGFNGVLTVNRLSADGHRVLDEGVQVFDGGDRHPTIEGPKLYKRNGYYYIFAPAGGVRAGWQVALRSRAVLGPYEDRVVLHQGTTAVNGPHQGAWVETGAGESWFLHFQDRGAYGRVVHLEPLAWRDDWPVIGRDADGNGLGEPVASFRKPAVRSGVPITVPQTSDDFNSRELGAQWQWNANPLAAWWSLGARRGWLRLHAAPLPGGAANLWDAPNLLLQKFPAEAFSATASVDSSSLGEGERAGLIVMGLSYASLAVAPADDGWHLVNEVCLDADKGTPESAEAVVPVRPGHVFVRVAVEAGATCRFSYSLDGRRFEPVGRPFIAREGRWIGARVGLFASGPGGARARGHVDVDWFRVQ
jgi:beta-xylosidase